MAEVGLIIAGATTAAQAIASQQQATQQNRAIRRSVETREAESEIAARERRNQIAESFKLTADRIRTSSGERGVAGAQSSAALELAAFSDAVRAAQNSDSQFDAQQRSFASSAFSQLQAPGAAGIFGGLQGLQLGLQLGNALENISFDPTPPEEIAGPPVPGIFGPPRELR